MKIKEHLIEVKSQYAPSSFEVKLLCPDAKNIAVYYSVTKGLWIISLDCSDIDAEVLRRLYYYD